MQGKHKVTDAAGQVHFVDLTHMAWLDRAKQPKQDRLICQLIGHSVKVWWPDDRRYYKGTVARYHATEVSQPTAENGMAEKDLPHQEAMISLMGIIYDNVCLFCSFETI